MAPAPQQLEDDLVRRPAQVAVVAGVGVSVATCGGHPNASWDGLLRHGLARCRELGAAASRVDTFTSLLNNPDATAGDMVSVATFVTDQLQSSTPGDFNAWMSDAFREVAVRDGRLVRAIDALGGNIATTNYDHLIEEVTGRAAITWRQRHLAGPFFRGQCRDVMHLHGSYREPNTVVLGTKSYAKVCGDAFSQAAMQSLMIGQTVVFIGCGAGLADPNFGALLDWSEGVLAACTYSHFILVRQQDVAHWRDRLRRLRIQPVAYGNDYADLAPYLEQLSLQVRASRNPQSLLALTDSQNDFDSRWAALNATREPLQPPEHLRQARQLAGSLRAAGGLHRAAMAFSNWVHFRSDGLLVGDFIGAQLDAAEWLLDDDLPRLASNHLHMAATRCGEIGASDLTDRLHALQARCYGVMGAYRQQLEAIGAALPHADADARERLEAERDEASWLQGEYQV